MQTEEVVVETGEISVGTEVVVGKDEEINTDILNYWSSCSLTDSIVNYKTI